MPYLLMCVFSSLLGSGHVVSGSGNELVCSVGIGMPLGLILAILVAVIILLIVIKAIAVYKAKRECLCNSSVYSHILSLHKLCSALVD